MSNPNEKSRDSIIQPAATAPGQVKRADLLNGHPRVRSLGNQGASYSDVSPKDTNAPAPNNPYR